MRTETHHSAKSTGAAGLTAQWAKENPRSAALAARAAALLPGGVTHDVRLADPFPVAVARAGDVVSGHPPLAQAAMTVSRARRARRTSVLTFGPSLLNSLNCSSE